MAETQTSSSSSTDGEATKQGNSFIVNQSSENGQRRRVRRHSRRKRSTSLLSNSGLNFHYLVGALLFVTLFIVIYSNKISKKIWAISHPVVAPAAKAGAAVSGRWFHVELLALAIGIIVWLYLLPGFADRVLSAIGLVKEKDYHSRRRHR